MADGIYDRNDLIDSMIVDCNNIVGDLINGHYIRFSNRLVQMVQKLTSLKTGVNDEIRNRDETIESLKGQIRELGGECITIPVSELEGE